MQEKQEPSASTSSPWIGFPPEAKIVFLSAGSDTEIGKKLFLNACQEVRDWPAAIAFSQREGALPTLSSLARSEQLHSLPVNLKSQINMLSGIAEFRAAMMKESLTQIIGSFHSKGIETVLLKGSALALTAYQRFADRPMGDFDILVKPQHVESALQTALESGWIIDPRFESSSFFDSHQHLPPLILNKGIPIRLELHTDLVADSSPVVLPSTDIWNKSVPCNTIPCRIPSAQHLLLHACVHFAWSHAMMVGGWKAFRDIARIIEVLKPDPEEFAKLCREARARSSAEWSLRLAYRLGGVQTVKPYLVELGASLGSSVSRSFLEKHFASLLSSGMPQALPLKVQHGFWELAIKPDLEGHGNARPWDRDEDYDPNDKPEEEQESLIGRARTVSKYLKSVVFTGN